MHLDLGDPATPGRLRGLSAQRDVRGVRDFGVVDHLAGPAGAAALDASLGAMEEVGLLLDLDCSWEHMAAARKLAQDHERLTIVLEHIGYPRRRDDTYFASWSPAIRDLAQAPNVYCKLSGLGMTDRNWTTGSLRRWVWTSIEAFGPSRCMFRSRLAGETGRQFVRHAYRRFQ